MPLLEHYYSFPHVNSQRVESAKDNLLQNKTRELPIQVQSGKWFCSLLVCLIWVTLTLWGKSNWQTATNLFVFIGQFISVTNFELQNHICMLKFSQCLLSWKEQAAWCSKFETWFLSLSVPVPLRTKLAGHSRGNRLLNTQSRRSGLVFKSITPAAKFQQPRALNCAQQVQELFSTYIKGGQP